MTIILKENSPEVREKIRTSGIKLCPCTEFNDSVWLDFNPDVTDCVHGVGYYDEYELFKTVQESLDYFLAKVKDPIFCKDVDEFIETIRNNQNDTRRKSKSL